MSGKCWSLPLRRPSARTSRCGCRGRKARSWYRRARPARSRSSAGSTTAAGTSSRTGSSRPGRPGRTAGSRTRTTRAGPTPGGYQSFRGFGRCQTAPDGSYRIVTLKPGPLPAPDGGIEAPHLDVSVFARGMLDRVVTRMYFPDEQTANAADPVLCSIAAPARRATLIAVPEPESELRFDIRLQGDHETVFFEV